MRIFLTIAILSVTFLLFPGIQSASAGYQADLEQPKWQLQGEATFRWTLIRVYDGKFYLGDRSRSADPLAPDVSRKLRLDYNVSIAADKIASSGTQLLRENLTDSEWLSIADDVEKINNAYRDVSSGDFYELIYIKNSGTRLMMNQEEIVHIENPAFGSLYFRIWLGENPIRASFRDQLLGK